MEAQTLTDQTHFPTLYKFLYTLFKFIKRFYLSVGVHHQDNTPTSQPTPQTQFTMSSSLKDSLRILLKNAFQIKDMLHNLWMQDHPHDPYETLSFFAATNTGLHNNVLRGNGMSRWIHLDINQQPGEIPNFLEHPSMNVYGVMPYYELGTHIDILSMMRGTSVLPPADSPFSPVFQSLNPDYSPIESMTAIERQLKPYLLVCYPISLPFVISLYSPLTSHSLHFVLSLCLIPFRRHAFSTKLRLIVPSTAINSSM